MKNVLIVGDKKAFLLYFRAGLAAYKTKFKVLTSRETGEALELLGSESIDLVVLNLTMPEMRGFDFLLHLSHNFSAIPVLLILDKVTPERLEKLNSSAGCRVVEKPRDFEAMAELILEILQKNHEGKRSKGISIANLLLLLENEKKTCLLQVHKDDGERKGIFYFDKGVLYDAVCRNLNGEILKGEEAVSEMIGWQDVKLSLKRVVLKKSKRNVKKSVSSLVTEGIRNIDNQGEQRLDGLDADTRSKKEILDLNLLHDQVDDSANENESKALHKDAKKTAPKEEASEKKDHMEGGETKGKVEKEGKEKEKISKTHETKNVKGGKTIGLKDVMQQMANEIEGLISTALIRMDGVTIADINPTGSSTDEYSANSAMVMKLEQRICNNLPQFGPLEENILQAQNVFFFTRMLGEHYYLGIVISRKGTLGMVRMVAKKYEDQLKAALP